MNFISSLLNVYKCAFKSVGDLFLLVSIILGKGSEVAQAMYSLLMNDQRYSEVKADFKAAISLYLQAMAKVADGVTKLQKIEGVDADLAGFNSLMAEAAELIDIKAIFAEAGAAVKDYEQQGNAMVAELIGAFPEEMAKLVPTKTAIEHEVTLH